MRITVFLFLLLLCFFLQACSSDGEASADGAELTSQTSKSKRKKRRNPNPTTGPSAGANDSDGNTSGLCTLKSTAGNPIHQIDVDPKGWNSLAAFTLRLSNGSSILLGLDMADIQDLGFQVTLEPDRAGAQGVSFGVDDPLDFAEVEVVFDNNADPTQTCQFKIDGPF